MKKTKILIPALLVAMACSCGPEVIETPGGDARTIGFTARQTSSPSGPSTRGTAIEDVDGLIEEGSGFIAWTYAHEGAWPGTNSAIYIGDAQNGVTVTPDGGEWNYGDSKYWPANKMVTSFAIAPASAVGNGATVTPASGADDAPSVSYTLPAPGSAQHDLLFAAVAENLTSADGSISEIFHHALSQISFKAYKKDFTDPTTSVVIQSITLNNVKNSGTASLETPVDWEDLAGDEEYTFNFADGTAADDAASVATADAFDAGVGSIFMIPQELTGVTIDVTYTVDSGAPQTKTGISLTGEWAPGQSYAITLAISPDEVEIIEPVIEGIPADKIIVIGSEGYPEGYYFIEAWGGNGGNGGGAAGGAGGVAEPAYGLYYFEEGNTLYIQVGEAGTAGGDIGVIGNGGAGTYFGQGGNGGSARTNGSPGVGGGGGGAASGVLLNGTSTADIILAAPGGGGGGGGKANYGSGGPGASAGGGAANANGYGGTGASAASNANNAGGGGGGGGGWNGAGGGGTGGTAGAQNAPGGGGNGGESYNQPAIPETGYTAPIANAIDGLHDNSQYPVRPGANGYVIISYLGE